jgi:hypothetical protein
MRPRMRSETRGKRTAGSTNASASKTVMVGSVSQLGAEESIKGSENHPDKKRQRAIQDSIVEDSPSAATSKGSGENGKQVWDKGSWLSRPDDVPKAKTVR